MRRKVLLATFTLISAASLAGTFLSSSKSTAEHTIRISLLGTAEDEDYDGTMVFKEHVEAASNGRIAVEVYTSGQFCSNERECIEALQAGVLQVFMITTGGFGAVYGPAQALDLPYLFGGDAIAECVLDGPITNKLSQAVLDEDIGIRLMTVSNTGGWRNFATTDSQIRTPDDVRGRKIRTITAPLQQELIRQLGGNPTPIPWSEVYTALATGVVAGTKNGIHDIVSMQLHEQIRFVTLDNHAYMGGLWWYSELRWQQLNEELQAIVLEGFRRLKTATRSAIKGWEAESSAAFVASGGTLHTPTAEEKQMFRESVRGMRDWYTDTYGVAWLADLDAEVAACELQVNGLPQ